MTNPTSKLQASVEEQTELEFELQMHGVESNDIDIYLYIDHDHLIGFECKHVEGDTWSVTIPPLEGIVPSGTHDYSICVYVEGYYFKPVEGSIHVMAQKPSVSIKTNNNQQDEPQVTFTKKGDNNDGDGSNRQDTGVQPPSSDDTSKKDDDDEQSSQDDDDKEEQNEQSEKNDKKQKRDKKTNENRQPKKQRQSFFAQGSPEQLAERIRNMPSENQTDRTVKRILREHKSR